MTRNAFVSSRIFSIIFIKNKPNLAHLPLNLPQWSAMLSLPETQHLLYYGTIFVLLSPQLYCGF